MVAFRSATRVGKKLEFKLVSALSMGQGWLLRPSCILLAGFWQSHDPHPIQQHYICPGCGCCCAPAVDVLFLHKNTLSSVSRDACAGSTAAWAENLSQLPHLDSPPGALPAQLEQLQPGLTWSLGFAQGGRSKSPGKALGVSWSPGFHLYLEADDFSCIAFRAISSLSLCSPSASELPGSGTASSLSPFSA